MEGNALAKAGVVSKPPAAAWLCPKIATAKKASAHTAACSLEPFMPKKRAVVFPYRAHHAVIKLVVWDKKLPSSSAARLLAL